MWTAVSRARRWLPRSSPVPPFANEAGLLFLRDDPERSLVGMVILVAPDSPARRIATAAVAKNASSQDSFGRTACAANAQHTGSAGPSSAPLLTGDCRVDGRVRTHNGRAHGSAGHGPRARARSPRIDPRSRRPEKRSRHNWVRTSDPYRVNVTTGVSERYGAVLFPRKSLPRGTGASTPLRRGGVQTGVHGVQPGSVVTLWTGSLGDSFSQLSIIDRIAGDAAWEDRDADRRDRRQDPKTSGHGPSFSEHGPTSGSAIRPRGDTFRWRSR